MTHVLVSQACDVAWPSLRGLALAGCLTAFVSHAWADGANSAPNGKSALASIAALPSVEAGPHWSELTAREREALAPLQREWPRTDPERKAKWLEMAARLPLMGAEQRRRVQERMTEWAKLSPEQRGRARLQYQEAKRAAPDDRRAQWNAYQSLPTEARRQLAERAALQASAPATPRGLMSQRADPNAQPAPRSKSSVVSAPAAPAKVVSPTVVRAPAGATTSLVTRPPSPPMHQQAGLPKIAATPGFVDQATLLPQRGAQGAAMQRSALTAPPVAAKP